VNNCHVVSRVGSCSVSVKIRTLVLMEGFDCEAYGPNSGLTSDDCFMAGDELLFSCDTPHHCAVRMRVERQRIWQAIQRLAATDPKWELLGNDIRHPEQILGGSLSAPPLSSSSEEDL
jgi:hypothetical protein